MGKKQDDHAGSDHTPHWFEKRGVKALHKRFGLGPAKIHVDPAEVGELARRQGLGDEPLGWSRMDSSHAPMSCFRELGDGLPAPRNEAEDGCSGVGRFGDARAIEGLLQMPDGWADDAADVALAISWPKGHTLVGVAEVRYDGGAWAPYIVLVSPTYIAPTGPLAVVEQALREAREAGRARRSPCPRCGAMELSQDLWPIGPDGSEPYVCHSCAWAAGHPILF